MAPRLGASEPPVPVEAGMNAPLDELNLTPVITEETHSQKRPPMKIVWRNVILMAMLHLSSVYALTLIFKAKVLTLLWSKYATFIKVYVFLNRSIIIISDKLAIHKTQLIETIVNCALIGNMV